jgi:transposase-like protein
MAKVSRRRRFSREFKLKVVARMEAGESGSELARELSIKRTILYRWRDKVRRGGDLALRAKAGRPNKTEARAMAIAQGVAAKANDLSEARRQIAALEAKVGRQQVDLDFFKQALQRIEASRRPNEGPGGTASSPKSRR